MLLLIQAVWGCPEVPTLRDDDDARVVLAQNIKFIVTGGRKPERARLLAGAMAADPAVDLLLLSEARQTGPLIAALPEFCFYRQSGRRDGYRWEPAAGGVSPGGLVLGVRERAAGEALEIQGSAGRAFESRPLTFADGFLGPLAGFVKGFAEVRLGDPDQGVRLVWSHLQASYSRRDRGAGRAGAGRQGQLMELAAELEAAGAALLTGDLNLNDPRSAADSESLQLFERRSGIPLQGGHCPEGSWHGSIWQEEAEQDPYFTGADFDRVGMSAALRQAYPVEIRCVDIQDGSGGLRLSDHRGLRIRIGDGAGTISPERTQTGS